jgi:hypothetical protein
MTRRVLIEQIRRLYYGGVPGDDANLTENEVNQYISQAIAYVAKINYTDSIKLDGVETVSDAFYATFKNLSLTLDSDTGYWYATLPHPPLGLSRGYGISSVTFPVSTGLAKAPVPISPREIDLIDNMKKPPSKIFYWAEGGRLYFKSPYYNLNTRTPIVRMVSAESTDLTAEVNVPGEHISEMINWILTQLRVRKGMPEDTTNDGLDKA